MESRLQEMINVSKSRVEIVRMAQFKMGTEIKLDLLESISRKGEGSERETCLT